MMDRLTDAIADTPDQVEIREAVRRAMEADPSARNQGALMKAVLPGLRGQADGALVRQVVLEELASAEASASAP